MYEPLVGMAAFMSTDTARPRGLITIEALTIEPKVVVTGELVGTSGNAGLVGHQPKNSDNILALFSVQAVNTC